MERISFLFYYLKLRFSVVCGIHKTCNPLDVKWRWNYWRRGRGNIGGNQRVIRH